MQQAHGSLTKIIKRYQAPLQRYALFIIKDTAVASSIIKNVFELVYEENGFAKPEQELRRQFKNYTLTACRYWLQLHASPTPKTL